MSQTRTNARSSRRGGKAVGRTVVPVQATPGGPQGATLAVPDVASMGSRVAVTGEADYLVKMVAPDLPSLATLLNDIFLPHESVAHVRSSIALTTLKDSRLLPVTREAQRR